ncbi:MAG: hypothetical protein J5I91_07550 [Bacteroidetes bacterium]|nr:hypothetical protein [Bacteroidota bacterium]
MFQVPNYKKTLKLIGILLLAIYSLASCDIKEVVLNLGGIEYVKPINKSRTKLESQNCDTGFDTEFFDVENKNSNSFTSDNYFYSSENNYAFDGFKNSLTVYFSYSELFANNEIPKFILYKRLRIGA